MPPHIPEPLSHIASETLEFPRLRELVAGYASTAAGREWTLALAPSGDATWALREQQRAAQMLHLFREGFGFDFHGLADPTSWLERARIPGAVLEIENMLAAIALIGRFHAFQQWQTGFPSDVQSRIPDLRYLARPLLESDFSGLQHALEGKFEPDGSFADNASPELARIRRQMAHQHRAIENSLRQMLRRLAPEGGLQENLITVRGDRFVLPVKAEWKRRVPGVLHGASSSGQTFFIEPLETIEQNNELQRLLEEEQSEIQRILAAMTRKITEHADAIAICAATLAEMESLHARARFAQDFQCTTTIFSSTGSERIALKAARHPLLEKRLRGSSTASSVIPLNLALENETRQLIISGPNTGGKTVALKTVGLLALMAQAGIPVPAESAELPFFDAVLADIGDAQSIAQDLSTFSAHILRLNSISSLATSRSLVLLDELGSATDPEEGAALAAAIAAHFVRRRAWCLISTHHTSLKVYAANTPGVQNAAAGFDEETFAPTYQIRMGVPGISAGIQIAQRLGLDSGVVAEARERLGKQSVEIGAFLDRLHADLLTVETERTRLRQREDELSRERLRLEREGQQEQKRKVQEMESKLASLLKGFEHQAREAVRGIDDRAAQQKVAKHAERGLAKLRREFREQVDAAVVAHRTGADKNDPNAQPHVVRSVAVGDTVLLRSLGKNARVERQLDADTFEVSAGPLKMKIRRGDIAEVVRGVASPVQAARSKGIRVSLSRENAAVPSEINLIGRTVEEATDSLEKFLDQAFLEGLPRIRIVHGSGMGILRKALRAYLVSHPHVAGVTEPGQGEGGAGVTVAEMRQ
jgi:DNA mismatch repair protein MutS2